jgi:hypothetical protein
VLAVSGTKESEMKPVEKMTLEERQECFEHMQIFIESAVQSEQPEPDVFKPETEKRIDLVLINLRELLGLS